MSSNGHSPEDELTHLRQLGIAVGLVGVLVTMSEDPYWANHMQWIMESQKEDDPEPSGDAVFDALLVAIGMADEWRQTYRDKREQGD